MHPELDRLLDPTYVEGLDALPIGDLRERRAACLELEEAVSLLRRVIQGRLDILGTELARRDVGKAPSEAAELVDRLPEVLAEHGRAPGWGQPPRSLRLPAVYSELSGALDQLVPPGLLSDVAVLDRGELAGLVGRLETLEQEVSGARRRLHVQIDALQAEITRRYRTGEASVDALLT